MPERQKRVTLKDVADYCGLSRSLVAFIISNSGYRNSTPENRRKVARSGQGAELPAEYGGTGAAGAEVLDHRRGDADVRYRNLRQYGARIAA